MTRAAPPPPFADSPRVTRTALRVRFYETDLMGIVHHGNYLHYFELGRVEWLRERGLSYETWLARGAHLPVVDLHVRYRRAARFDEELVLETYVEEVTNVTVRFAYRLFRGAGAGADLVCEGESLLACVGDDMRPKRLPPDVVDVLRAGLDEAPPARP